MPNHEAKSSGDTESSLKLEFLETETFLPSVYSIILNVSGIVLLYFGLRAALIGLLLFVDPILRYTQIKVALLMAMIFLLTFPLSIRLLFKNAAKILRIDSEGITVRPVLLYFKKDFIRWKDLKYTEVEDKTTFLSGLIGPNYKILILSLDTQIRISTRHFRKRDRLFSIFTSSELTYDDVFIKFFFYRGRGSIFSRLISDPAGIFSVVVISLLMLIYLWGAIAQFVNPAESLQVTPVETLGLKNPEYQYGFDQDYGKYAVDQPALDITKLTWDDIISPPFYIMGSDYVGRDLFSRLIYSTFFSLNIVIFFAFLSTLLGTLLGATFGYIGGKVDQVFLTISDMAIAVPPFVLWIIGASFTFEVRKLFGGVFIQIFAFMLIFMWSTPARLIRSEVINLKKQEYIEAERVYGATNSRILFKHIFPNLKPLIATVFITQMIELLMAMITIAIIIGAESDLVWGSDISRRLDPNYYEQNLGDLYILYSIVFYTLFIFGLLIFAETLKDALDPRFSKKKANKRTLRRERIKIEEKTKRITSRDRDKLDNIVDRDLDALINSDDIPSLTKGTDNTSDEAMDNLQANNLDTQVVQEISPNSEVESESFETLLEEGVSENQTTLEDTQERISAGETNIGSQQDSSLEVSDDVVQENTTTPAQTDDPSDEPVKDGGDTDVISTSDNFTHDEIKGQEVGSGKVTQQSDNGTEESLSEERTTDKGTSEHDSETGGDEQ